MAMTTSEEFESRKPLLGIGSCLAGYAVRYNAESNPPNQHVRDLCTHFETRDFCPEIGIGLGVPRPPIHLVGDEHLVRVLDVTTHSHDYTDQIRAYAQSVLERAPSLCGYILVKGSPSCGYGRVKRYSPEGELLARDQHGIFAAALAALDPLLPLEDDGRLNDPGLRESFATRACAYHEWKALTRQGLTAHGLVEFYSRYKYLVMAHHIPSYKSLGPMLAHAGRRPLDELAAAWIGALMAALTQRATRRSHSNVLFHIAGYLKRRITAVQRRQLNVLIEEYRTGKIPLSVPINLLKQHFAEHPNAYINGQVFLDPYPEGLRVRNLE
jgi:uncharacterized protein YbgA (DUF1722 family)/uncharacterized protein YbbK (DUF523 family)